MSDSSQIIFQAPEIDQLAPLFPAYQIEYLIATGGMGAVYKAVQKSLDRAVAIKILPREFSQDPGFCAGFEAEAKSMARLNHPNLIGVYDFGEVDGMLFIVMEFVPGQSLFHCTHGHAVESNEVIRLITAICQGLAHAHENGIIHRDIKPSNVLLDHQNNPKIGDFGLAHPVGTGHQEGAQIYGTPGYTAPEVVNDPKSVNHRADIFSIGVLLHELLTGKLPASDQRPASQIAGCNLRFDAIIKRATAEVPETRYPNAHQIVADISQIQGHAATGPTANGPATRRGPTAPSASARSMPARPSPRRSPSAPAKKKFSGISMTYGLIMLILVIALGYLAYKRHIGEALFIKRSVITPNGIKQPVQPVSPTPAPKAAPEAANAFLAASLGSANAADYTWDTSTATGIQATSGTWSTTGTNWNSGGSNFAWSQTTSNTASHNAIFSGTDGTYAVTLSGTTNAQSVAFNNSGYTLSGGTLTLRPTGTTNGAITVAAGKTATINSILSYSDNTGANVTVSSGGTLNLGGGASNSQYRFKGAGTINMTAGTYEANVGYVNTGTFNQSGGTYTMNLPSGGDGHFIGDAVGRSVSYTMSGSAILNVNASGTTDTNSFLAIGRGAGNTAYSNTLNVTGAANLNVGNATNMAGELLIASDNVSNGTLNVSGSSAVLVGVQKTDNKIYFFKAGSGAGYTARMTQSGGTVTANGIQFGGTSGTYDASSAANLTLSGGTLYVGLQGITRGSGATALPVTIKLQGGTLGANQNWSSPLNMQLGTAGGGVTVRAQDATTNSRTITLSGALSNVSGVNGTLTKTGAGTLTLSGSNTYTGATTVTTGTMALGASNVLPNLSAVSIGAATLDAATFADTAGTLDVTGAATINLGSGATLAFADSSAVNWSGGTLNITGTFVPGTSLRFGTTDGGLTVAQLRKISASGSPTFTLNSNGYLVGNTTPPVAAPEARFNVPDFLTQAQGTMKKRGEFDISTYRSNLHDNLKDFERSLKSSLRDIPIREHKDLAEQELASMIENCANEGGRIPNMIKPQLAALKDAQKDLEKHLQKQSKIDLQMIEELEPLRETYISGLELKRKMLIKDHDDVAAAQIAEEIELTRNSESHFQEVMECQIPVVQAATE
jgi:autotransporter-associated beta strand protein